MIRAWWRERRVNALLVLRAGIIAEQLADARARRIDPQLARDLGQIDERLRQLGYKEKL